MLDVACLIVGIDGWDQYTAPLVWSINRHEGYARIIVIDNESETPYPSVPYVHRTRRLSYAAAINEAAWVAGDADWYVVLSNDVVCTGPFRARLGALGNGVYGPHLMTNQGWQYIEGWCVAANRHTWRTVGGWDGRFIMSSWEDVDFSQSAREEGLPVEWQPLPFKHLDQMQRFALPGYAGSEGHNYGLFVEKHGFRSRVAA